MLQLLLHFIYFLLFNFEAIFTQFRNMFKIRGVWKTRISSRQKIYKSRSQRQIHLITTLYITSPKSSGLLHSQCKRNEKFWARSMVEVALFAVCRICGRKIVGWRSTCRGGKMAGVQTCFALSETYFYRVQLRIIKLISLNWCWYQRACVLARDFRLVLHSRKLYKLRLYGNAKSSRITPHAIIIVINYEGF